MSFPMWLFYRNKNWDEAVFYGLVIKLKDGNDKETAAALTDEFMKEFPNARVTNNLPYETTENAQL